MDTVAYVCRERDANAARFEVPLISIKATAFSDDEPALLSLHRRLLCMNMKQSNKLRVLSLRGTFADTEVRTPVLRHLVSSEGHLDYCAFFAVGGQKVIRLKPLTHANGELQILQNEATLREELYGVAVGDNNSVYVLGKAHVFEVDMEASVTKAAIDLASKIEFRLPVISYHHEAKLLIAPAKSHCLDLISTISRKSVLPKVWEPHGSSVPTAAFFFQRRKFSSEPDSNVLIVTAARGNTELRFWSYSPTTRTFSLRQDLCISIAEDELDNAYSVDGSDGGGVGLAAKESFLISCTPTEDYITLCSTRRPVAVVVELHRSNFNSASVTSWRLRGPVVASVATVGKVAETANSTSVAFHLMLTIRTATGFYEEVFAVENLLGASTTALQKRGSVGMWFSKAKANNVDAAAALPTALTSVSSSVLGDKTTNAVSQGVASKVVRQQAHQFCDALRNIDGRMVDLQKRASDAMRLLQEARAREDAQTLGRRFATRNKGRLEQQQQQQQQQLRLDQSTGITESQEEFFEELSSVLGEVESISADSAQESLKALIPHSLKNLLASVVRKLERLDSSALSLDTSFAEHARAFSNGLDTPLHLLFRPIKERNAVMQKSLAASSSSTANCLSKAKEFVETLRREMQLMACELKETTNATAEAPVEPEVLLSRAVTAAELKDWATAFTTALGAADINVLLSFLESKVCLENMSTITQAKVIPLPTFISLCLQLSFELDTQPELISSRIQFLHTFYVEWDDTLREFKQNAMTNNGTQDKVLFELARRELQCVLKDLESVKEHSAERRTRNSLRLLRKLIAALVGNA